MVPLVVAAVEKATLWACVGSLTPWLWLGSLTPWAWVGSLTPWLCDGICAVLSATVCAPPASPSTVPSMPEAPAVLDQPGPSRAPVSGVDDGGGVTQRHADVPQRGQGARTRQLPQPVAAVAGAVIDLSRDEQPDLVVVPQRLHRQPRQLRERADTNQLA